MLKKLLGLSALLCLWLASGQAQNPWHDVSERAFQPAGKRVIVPQKYRAVALDVAAMQNLMAAAPLRFSPAASRSETDVQIPMPDGSMQWFRLFESPVMEPELQAKYPSIRCYTGVGLDDPSATMKCDLTPKGFHAMILAEGQSPVFIDPYALDDTEHYVSYFKKDYARRNAPEFICEMENDAPVSLGEASQYVAGPNRQGDCQLRKYRLALACTGEYANYHGATGANKAPAIAAMNTTMNRVNGVYERETAVTMMLVANNDLLVYTNSGTDPYTNNNGGTMLGQNVSTCNSVIGTANYDMGHVFSTGGGGIAGLGVICGTNKARGVTGLGAPIGDGFDIDYVAHEMGHQFGGNHTFNSTVGACNGNGNSNTAMEPGSGTTIMAYAGICGSTDVQPHSDDYFAAISLQEIGNFITLLSGNSCAQKTVTGNHIPTVNAGADRIIPKSTPFVLTATGSDQDGDPVTYCWEQMDPESATMPPVATNTVGPLFRSFNPTASPTRYFPRLSDLNANTTYAWEKLPSVARNMKFRVTIRDNHAGAGCTEEDDMVVTVNATAGPFVVTEPNTNVLWNVGEPKVVTWNVAGTNAAPVNCSLVKISLSTDGGLTYPIVLADNEMNDGSANVTVPNNVSSTCRVKVESVGNIFFDISNVNFRIQTPPVPTFLVTTSTNALTICAGETGAFNANLTSILNFNDPVNLSVTGLPAGAVALISPNPAMPQTSPAVDIQISGLTPAMAGDYTLTVSGTSGTTTQTATLALKVLPGEPSGLATATAPADGAGGVALNTTLSWGGVQFATTTTVQVSASPSFNPVLTTGTVSGASASLTGLAPSTVYYWRVQAANTCGISPYSATFAFQTGKETCNQTFASTNVPTVISPTIGGVVKSTLSVPVNKSITDANITFNVAHTYVGDLAAMLISPQNDTVALFDQPGIPTTQFGCDGDNMVATLDDEGAQTAAAFDNMCNNTTPPAISGTFKPLAALSKLDGKASQGTWTFLVNDLYATEDGGQINSWSLTFCFADPVLQGAVLANTALTVPSSQTRALATANLQSQAAGMAGQLVYTLLSQPAHGLLRVNGNLLAVGGTFTQANIDGGQVAYTHNGDAATADQFAFDVLDQSNAAWVHGSVFQIVILQNSLAASAAQTGEILCAGGSDGEITVSATGGAAPLSYSLNGGAGQSSNVFSGLGAGDFMVVVSDANGFSLATNLVQITAPDALSLTAVAEGDSIRVAANGGTGAYTFSADAGSGPLFTSDEYFADVAEGTYTVVVTDGNGCSASTEVLIAINSLLTAISIQAEVSCAGEDDGAIHVSVAGGHPPYQFSLNGGAAQSDGTFAGLAAGTYSVVVTDDFGFSATTNDVTLLDPTPIDATADVNFNTVVVAATGGTGNYEYSLDGGVFQSSNTFANVPNGDYFILVQDANGCSGVALATVDVPALTASVTIDAEILCNGGGAALTASASGGIPPYTYQLDANVAQSSASFTNVAAGQHTVIVLDAAGTAFTATVDLTQPDPVAVAATTFSNDLTAVASGGTAPYTYAMTNTGQTPPYNDLPNGTYTIIATDANGCTGAGTATIDYKPISATTQVASVKCAGGSDGRILASAAGGVAPYELSIDGTNFQSSGLFENLPAGTYDITIRDAAGDLFVLAGVTVNEPTPVVFDPAIITGNSLTVSASGGTGAIQYSLDGGAFQSSGTFTNLSVGTHTITARDANGCTATLEVTIVYEVLTASVTPDAGTCVGAATGSAIVCINGGSGMVTLTLNPGLGSLDIPPGNCDQNFRFINLPGGTYTVVIADITTGVTATQQFTIENYPLVGATAASNFDDIIVTPTSGTAPYQYSINGGALQSSNTFADLPVGTYSIRVVDANGCSYAFDYILDYVSAVEPSTAWGLTVSPNPSSGLFQVSATAAPANGLIFKVFDAAGRLVRSEFSAQSSASLDLSELPAGMYLLQISDGQRLGAVRLAKM